MPTKTVLDSFRLDGRKALVTGGAKGLGRVIATALSQAGAEVAIVSRTLADCESAAAEIRKITGRSVAAFKADVTQSDQVTKLASDVGTVDILVNNAGINVRGMATELSEADWVAVINVNLKAPFLCSRTFAPAMCQRGWGRVINMGSILSVIALPGRAPYASAKAGVVNLTRVLALEWATAGVTVNAICPGPFATDMNKPLLNDPEKYKAFVAKIPMGRWGELDETAAARSSSMADGRHSKR